MSVMRAKMNVISVARVQGGEKGQEDLELSAVCSSGFGEKGESEDNTYARYTPCASLTMSITNPDLLGKFNPGDAFYVDFTKAD